MIREISYDLQPKALSAYVEAPFDEGKAILEADGYDIISAAKNAEFRIQEGHKSNISRSQNWTREAWLYIPKRRAIIFSRFSPIMENPVEATQANREGKEFYPTNEQIEKMIDSSISIKVHYNKRPIPTDRFSEEEITVFAFGNGNPTKAQLYGDFLSEARIKKVYMYLSDKDYVNKQSKPFARQNWFYSTVKGCGESGLSTGGNRGELKCLHFDLLVRGMLQGEQ